MKGYVGWIMLVALVVTFDVLSRETMSKAFWKGLAHPIFRWFLVLAWLMTTLHLFRPWTHIPKQLDVLYWLERLVR